MSIKSHLTDYSEHGNNINKEMESYFYLHDIIHAYLKDELSRAEVDKVEELLKTDSEFYTEFYVDQYIVNYFNHSDIVNVQKLIEEISSSQDIITQKEYPITEINNLKNDDWLVTLLKDNQLYDNLFTQLQAQYPLTPVLENKRSVRVKSFSANKFISPLEDELFFNQLHFQFTKPLEEATQVMLFQDHPKHFTKFMIPTQTEQFKFNITDLSTGLYYLTINLEGVPISRRFYVCNEKDIEELVLGVV